ncbi:MAG TPA: hypothetical protein VFI08_04010 [Spirochaetia bacterium]|nr:hypothetical protein [Spirochaetia bacterium]
MQGIGSASAADFTKNIEALAQLLQSTQEMASQTSEKLLKVSVQQAVQDAAVGNAVDLTA